MNMEIYQLRPTLDEFLQGKNGESTLYCELQKEIDDNTAKQVSKAAGRYEFTLIAIQKRGRMEVIYECQEGIDTFDATDAQKLTKIPVGAQIRFRMQTASEIEKAALEEITRILDIKIKAEKEVAQVCKG